MTIYLIRHGETALNAARILQPPETPLSEQGLLQAQALALRLRPVLLDAVLSSDLPRAVQTAQAVAKQQVRFSYDSIQTSALLQERNLGDFRGKPYDAIGVDLLRFQEAPPGGESMAQFEARVDLAFSAMKQLQERFTNLAVVTHGLVIREIIAKHLTLRDGQTSPQHIGNTSVTIFETNPPCLVDVLNSSDHL